MFECVLNISEGQSGAILNELSRAARTSLRDRHSDAFHHRSVFTLIDESRGLQRNVHSLIERAYELIDLTRHSGVHPRFGVVDVVPYVALDSTDDERACALRDETAQWISETFAVPVFLYGLLDDGTNRTLPHVRRAARNSSAPDWGPAVASVSRGSCAVGCRALLVAWNLWLEGASLEQARALAIQLRQPALRTMAFEVGSYVQVSCNVVDVTAIRLSEIYDSVLEHLGNGASIHHAELVGLAPSALVFSEVPERWAQLGLHANSTIESRVLR